MLSTTLSPGVLATVASPVMSSLSSWMVSPRALTTSLRLPSLPRRRRSK